MRRVLDHPDQVEWHQDWQRWVPAPAALRFDPDLSTFVERLLAKQQQGASDVASLGGSDDKAAAVYVIDVREVEELEYTVEHSPDDETPINHAHCSILAVAEDSKSQKKERRRRLAALLRHAYGEITVAVPDNA